MEVVINPFYNVYQKLFGHQPDPAQHCDPPIQVNNIKSDPGISKCQLKSEAKSEISERSVGELQVPDVEKSTSIRKRDSATQTDLSSVTPNKRKLTINDSLQMQKSSKRMKRETKRERKREELMHAQNEGSSYIDPKRFERNQPMTSQISKRKRDRLVNMIIIEYLNDDPVKILSKAAKDSQVKLKYEFHEKGAEHECTILFNNAQLAQALASCPEEAKIKAAAIGLQVLQRDHYTIKVSHHGITFIHRSDFENFYIEKLSDGLGPTAMGRCNTQGRSESSQGMLEPVIPLQKSKKSDVWLDHQKYVFVQKCIVIFKGYIRENTLNEIAFCSFTNEEVDLIVNTARSMGLCIRKSGKVNRRVRVMRIRTFREKLEFLLKSGGSFGNYQLIQPTQHDIAPKKN